MLNRMRSACMCAWLNSEVMFIEFIGFLLVGKLVVFGLQKFPFRKTIIGKYFREGKFLEQLFSCDFCLGFWVFSILAYALHIDFIKESFCVYIPVLNEALTGLIASFMVHVFSIGWQTKFGTTVINSWSE